MIPQEMSEWVKAAETSAVAVRGGVAESVPVTRKEPYSVPGAAT